MEGIIVSEEIEVTQEWDKVFPKSEKLNHKNVNSDELKNILGSGEVTLTLTLFK